MSHDSKLLEFADEGSGDPGAAQGGITDQPWRILIVDDDEDVHQATLFALKGLVVLERPLSFLHAHSAQQARQMLLNESDLALVFLDVVMETPNAGLDLVDFLRHQAGLRCTRVILRTGQPGYAPEHETIVRYDINDYKTKSELTHHKLLTTVTAALRAYDQLRVIEAGRRGLELIVRCSSGFLEVQGIQQFAVGVITQIAALLRLEPDGLVCAQHGRESPAVTVLAAAGRFAHCISQPVSTLADNRLAQLLESVLQRGESAFGAQETVLFLGDCSDHAMAAYVATPRPLQPVDLQLLSVFCVNLSAALQNFGLLQRLRSDAYEDPLLRIPNRNRLIEHLSYHVREQTPDALLVLVDVDDFAEINDLMGHAYADELLRSMGQRLAAFLGPEVVVSRVSSNCFGLLGRRTGLDPQAIRVLMRDDVTVGGQPHRVSVTMGLAVCSAHLSSGADWLKNAGIALKNAKRHHRGHWVAFSDEMASLARSRARLLEGLHRASGQSSLFTVYQPQVALESGQLIGFEALVRWRREDGQMVPPDQFIPVAEQSGLIVSLGDWILDSACADMARLKAAGLKGCHMAVNVSVVQFQSDDFFDRVLLTLGRHGLMPQDLELEVTESVAMLGRSRVEQVLNALRAQGVAVAIDDFGTGYSSLCYLEQLPLDRIKIDRAFVSKLQGDSGPRIAEMIVQLGRKLGLRVIAEGLEDAQAWRTLQALGCDEGQGYFIARPLPFEGIADWLAQWTAQVNAAPPWRQA
ncbi:MAG: EAL domain-containing protein [Rhodoferax sp.]